ncbi:serine/threonine-protein kinase [Blastococcus mobilis]|uniref:serine/threonine-protein kinase n=1 Tax=Blastococcus mobilis TaxID=1938746 RepID=UPI001C3D6D1C|nr:serine/threonine-protein kinase [Blastococcus mobilis]
MTTPGRLVAGRYRLQSQLGGGGMGTVWLARDELLGRQVAVKQVLTPAGVSETEADQQRQRALREGRIAARLSHPHAISVYDVALESGQPWLVMEYLPSRSLAAVLAEDGTLRTDQVAQIGAQVADALAATHAAGIVHRDVKPANILIGEGGRIEGLVKITDFGISHASGDVTLTQTGQITGTPAFLSPEVAQGREMTAASDVFSLGATLYTCVEGTPPFGMEDNALAMLHRVAGGQIVPPRRAGSLTEPLLRMLAVDPADRPEMTEVRDELARLAAGRDGDTTTVLLARTDVGATGPGRNRTAAFAAPFETDGGTPTPVPEPVPTPAPPARPGAEPRRRRGRALWITAALVATALAGLIAFLVMRPADDASDEAVTPSPSSSSAAAPSTEQTEEPATTTPVETTPVETTPAEQPAETPAAAQEALSADNVEQFLESYHELVLTDPAQAYALTGPTLRSAISESNYIDYWGQFEDVRLSDIRAADGRSTATATMELRSPGGRSESSRRQFTFLVRDGELILDSDYPVG